MTRVRLPRPDELAAEPPLAAVHILEIACVLAASALRGCHPSILGDFLPGEDSEISAARVLFDECGYFCETLSEYRNLVTARLARQRGDWPF